MKVGILGFGEVGPFFARQIANVGAKVSAFDTLLDNPSTANDCSARIADCGISRAASALSLVAFNDLIISTVTAANAFDAADSLGDLNGQDFLDLNSVGPATKLRIAEHVVRRGGTCTTGVAMDTVPQKGARVPLLISGPDADRITGTLNGLGLNARSVGQDHEVAPQIKLVRSIFIKGFEAIFAEAMSIAEPLNVWDEVCASLSQTFPGMDWAEIVPYHIARVQTHGARRAAEMLECAEMIEAMGNEADLVRAIAGKHAQVADQSAQIARGTNT